MAKVWHEYFNENDVEAWSIFHFQQNWERIHEGDYKQLSYEKATDALTKSLRAIINKSLDAKKIKKANKLLTTLQVYILCPPELLFVSVSSTIFSYPSF